VRVASKVGNLHFKFAQARRLGSRIIRYVRDRQTNGQMDGQKQRGGYCPSLPRPLLAVPNVTAHPSTASVPITILLYNGPLLCGFDVPGKGLIDLCVCDVMLQEGD